MPVSGKSLEQKEQERAARATRHSLARAVAAGTLLERASAITHSSPSDLAKAKNKKHGSGSRSRKDEASSRQASPERLETQLGRPAGGGRLNLRHLQPSTRYPALLVLSGLLQISLSARTGARVEVLCPRRVVRERPQLPWEHHHLPRTLPLRAGEPSATPPRGGLHRRGGFPASDSSSLLSPEQELGSTL